MIGRASGKRRAQKAPAEAGLPKRPRRGLWVMIAFCLLVFVIIVVYETQSELARERRAGLESGVPTADETTAGASSASLEPSTLAGRLTEYYRSHELPFGWVVIGSAAPDDKAGTVRIAFSPSPQDRRYGQPAPLEDVQNGSYCPISAKFWRGMEDRQVTVELSDKTGVIRVIECDPVSGAD